MRFVKMHGLGNDYIVVDAFDTPLVEDPRALCRVLSDRHHGVGCDGLLVLERSDRADFRMRIFNPDGSPGGMCVNGLRCAGKLLHEQGRVHGTELVAETGTELVGLELRVRGDRVEGARVTLASPRLRPDEIPVLLPGDRVVDHPLPLGDATVRVTCVSVGNPHCVIVHDDVERLTLAEIGPGIERHPAFPSRTNVEFVRLEGPHLLRQRTWERGAGETLACGSGAAAAVVACGLLGFGRGPYRVRLDGGELEVEWREEGVSVAGPAVEVFRGEWTGKG